MFAFGLLYAELHKLIYMRHSVKVIKQRVVGSQVLAPQADELAIEDPLELVIRYRAHDRFVED